MSDGVLITGGTGFLGMELVARLLSDDEGPDVFLLVRDRSRVDVMLASLYEEVPASAARLRPVTGDLTADGLGLSARDRTRLRGAVGRVVHCAASIRFDLPLAEARDINVMGTHRVLGLAGTLPGLERLVHVSTAYVAGRSGGVFAETDLDRGQPFRNTYEQTKWEAEALVASSGLPAAVVRPSIVVGESGSGWTPAFNVLYWPLQAFARGLVDVLPADPEGIVDVVGADHVTDVLHAAAFAPGASGTYAAVAGHAAPSVGELLDLAARLLDRPPPRIEAPHHDHDEHPSGVFAPYFDVACRFDDARTRGDLGLAAAPVQDLFRTIVAYARDTRWGRRGLSREAAARRALARAA